MKTYLVGGAVRDSILGEFPKDRDHLVIGSSAEEMLSNGFMAVGKSYSVFLHPTTREEYTLADDLKSDLSRRDLTINGLAMENDNVIDFFGGVEDLKRGILRHIKEENFFEDPLRVYRVARFKAKWPHFSIAPETVALIKKVALEDSFKMLNAERILLELSKALATSRPSFFFEILRAHNLLGIHFEELNALKSKEWSRTFDLLDRLTKNISELSVRFAALFIQLHDHKAFLNRFPFSNEWRDSGMAITRFYPMAKDILQLPADAIVNMLYGMDAFRKIFVVEVLDFILKAEGKFLQANLLEKAFRSTLEVTSSDVSPTLQGKDIGEAIRQKRVEKLATEIIPLEAEQNSPFIS